MNKAFIKTQFARVQNLQTLIYNIHLLMQQNRLDDQIQDDIMTKKKIYLGITFLYTVEP